MKGLQIVRVYDVNENDYPYVASDYEGRLCGFQNPPVRDFSQREWIDSVTGDPGDIIPYKRWDQSMREPSEMMDCHLPRKPKKPRNDSIHGKKGVVYGTSEFTEYKYKLKEKNP